MEAVSRLVTTNKLLNLVQTTQPSLSNLKQLHSQLIKFQNHNPQSHPIPKLFLSKLLALPSSSYAVSFFLHSPVPNSSSKILFKLSQNTDDPNHVIDFYARARNVGAGLDGFGLPVALKAATRVGRGCSGIGREVHGLGVRIGLVSDRVFGTGLVGFYVRCGCVRDAKLVFDGMGDRDIVAWNVMIDGYCQAGRYHEALKLFEDMELSDITPDPIILSTILNCCGRIEYLTYGQQIHSYITDNNIQIDSNLQTSLITMYSNCGSMEIAQKLYLELSPKNKIASTSMIFGYSKINQIKLAHSIFSSMHDKDLVAWSALISGYAESDQPNAALKLFNDMQLCHICPDEITMLSIISACANLGALDQAQWVYKYVNKNGFGQVVSVNNALIGMFSKCGSLVRASKIFNEMPERNVISWTAMITGLAMHGEGKAAISLFEEMNMKGVKPNKVTFIGLLYACSHSGLVDDCQRIFNSMFVDFGIEASQQHYGCLVDLYGRAKLFKEAVNLINSMPVRPNAIVWGSLLSACRLHGEIELGELAAKRILEIDPGHDGTYILLSNIYAKARRWKDVREIRNLMKNNGILKEKGSSWIGFNGEVHEFLMGDERHPRSKEVYEKLDEVVMKLEIVGYEPHLGTVLVNLEEEEKRKAILLHSEKLALSFGLINLGRSETVRIVKNLRICEDCHSFMKFASRVYEREIVVRDRTRFHHYKDGVCSCGDYW